MKYRRYLETDLIDKSRALIHAFMNRQMLPFAELLDENFVWIGDHSSQYIKGKNTFLKAIADELKLPPLELSMEEYSVLTHERHTWVTYGRHTVTSDTGAGQSLSLTIHFTLVWKQMKNDIYLMLASASHVQDEQMPEIASPNSNSLDVDKTSVPQARVFSHIQANSVVRQDVIKKRIRDVSGNLYFLFPDEIVYAASSGRFCTIYTVQGNELISRMPLNSLEQKGFLRIHSRYLVNRSFITSIRRYEVTLVDHTVLPVGKQRYNEVVSLLEKR